MAVNENVYGAADTWANAYYQQNTIANKNKIANFGDNTYTLAQGVSKGKLTYNEGIDKSISFCGLGEESALSHIAFIARTSSNTADVLSVNERFVTNFGFFERVDNSITVSTTDFRTNQPQNFAWGDYSNLNNFTKTLRPLTVVNPHNLVLCIYLKCDDANRNNPMTTTLKSYLQNYTQTRPRIYKVWVQAYFGDTIPRQVEAGQGTSEYRIPLQIGILDEYDFADKNLTFNSYQLQANNVIFGSFASGDYIYNIDQSFTAIAFTPNSREHLKIDYVSGSDIYYTSFEYYDDFEEDILKTVACFGLYFTTDNNVAQSGALTNNDMYIGLLDENGIGHGEYLRGADTVNAPQNEYTDMSQSGYDYTKDVDKTNYDNSTIFYPSGVTGAFTKSYVLNKTQVDELAQEAYNAVAQAPTGDDIENYNQRYFLTSNVIDCIISLKKFPCEPYTPQGPILPIKIGAYQTNISAYPLAYSVQQFDFVFSQTNNNTLYPIHGGDFRDYEPNTRCSISIPFCGNVEIPCAYAYRYDIKISLLIDLITGACTAFVICNNDVIETVNGNCAIDLPLSGLQSATLDSQMYSASNAKDKNKSALGLGIVGGAIAIGVGIATGGVAAAVGGAAAIIGSFINANNTGKAINYEMSHMQTPFKTISTASGNISQAYDMRCKMLIKRCVEGNYNDEVYGKTIGFACLRNGKVNDFTGLTQGDIRVDDVVNSIGMSPTDTEKQMIYNAFATGVIL